MKLISEIISNAKVVSPGIFIAASNEEDIITRTVLSKVAEELLSTKDVQAVFVIGKTSNTEVSVSARSLNDFNVHIIMEAMGGGGHFSTAATQLQTETIDHVYEVLEEKVKVFIRDGEI